ncbi:MAG: hypothetical protein K9J77_05650 [Rhodoferax sp.]|nr:hypothetical protein [Rhodoferax sp.]
MKSLVCCVALLALSGTVAAKLPPLNDEAKAKAAEAAAKAAHGGKVEADLLWKAQDRVAAQYNKANKPAAKGAAPAAPACVDPGAFAYTPPGAAASPATAVATAGKSDKPKK